MKTIENLNNRLNGVMKNISDWFEAPKNVTVEETETIMAEIA